MTELDTRTLRRALAAPAGQADTVDITTIVRRGRSLRRRRRFAAVAGASLLDIAELNTAFDQRPDFF